jgi:hypothetical protein
MRRELLRTGHEDGVALVAAVGAIMILLVISFGLILYGQNALTKVMEQKKYVKALNLADAGVDHVSWLYKNRSLPDSYYTTTITLNFGSEGQCKLRVYEGDVGFEKRIVSVGYAPDGTKKAVEVTLFSMNIWDLLLSAGNNTENRRPGGSGGIQGNGMVQGPLYIRGNLPMLQGTFDLYEGPLFVKDGSIVKGSTAGNIGTAAQRVQAYVEGNASGAIFNKQMRPLTSNEQLEAMNIYLSKLSRKVPDIEFPAITQSVLDENWNTARLEATDNKLPSYPASASTINFNEATISKMLGGTMTYYKVVDNDGAANASLKASGTIRIGSGSSFGIVDVDGDGAITNTDRNYWEFAYDASQRQLYIRGTVFVDGDVSFDGNVVYTGRGTLVINGTCTINGQLLASSDYPEVNALGLVVNGDLRIAVGSANDNVDDVEVAAFVQGDTIFSANNTQFYGAMIAGYIDMASANNIKLILAEALPSNLPPSLPASQSNIVTIIGWREVRVPAGF